MVKKDFELVSKYKPTGDQPQAIEKLVEGINDGLREQVLLGVTGSGKTFTMANVIAKLNYFTQILHYTCKSEFILSFLPFKTNMKLRITIQPAISKASRFHASL